MKNKKPKFPEVTNFLKFADCKLKLCWVVSIFMYFNRVMLKVGSCCKVEQNIVNAFLRLDSVKTLLDLYTMYKPKNWSLIYIKN